MASQVDICNLALSNIGARASIASLSEQSAEAKECARRYDACLEAVLQAAFWNFARKQVNGVLLKDGTIAGNTVPVPWLYEYEYPADAIQVRYVMPIYSQGATISGGATVAVPPMQTRPVRFVVSSDLDTTGNDIKCILTNQPNAVIVYTKKITNPALYDAQFVECFAGYLGAKICMALTGKRDVMLDQFRWAQQSANEAQASNGNEGLTVIDSTPDWIAARGFLSDDNYPTNGILYSSPVSLMAVS